MQLTLYPAERADAAARVQHLLRRKRSEKARLEREIEQVEREMRSLVESAAGLEALQQEIVALFEQAARRKGLSRRDVRAVRDVYEQLVEEGIVSPDSEDRDAPPCRCPVCAGEEEAPSQAGAPGDAAGAQEPPDLDHAAPTAPAPRQRGVRDLYRELALRFHPDRAGDDASRAHHEAMMRAVNAAYHGGDTDRLLRLSEELGVAVDHLRSDVGVLTELVRQYELLKEEVRWLRSTPGGQLVLDRRRASRRGAPDPIDEMRQMRDEALAMLQQVRDFVAAFVAGELTVAQFLAGPDAHDGDGDDDDDELEMLEVIDRLLAELGGAAFGDGVRTGRRSRSRAQRRQKRHKKRHKKRRGR